MKARIAPSRLAWTLCALLFAATVINYVDRQIIGLLKPSLASEFGWSERDYAGIVFWFQAAYAIGLVLSGRLLDGVGVRLGYAAGVVLWSAAAMAHALAGSVAGFAAARFALGLGESVNFPAAVKTVAAVFPVERRALATGVFNAGSNVGAMLTPLLLPSIVLAFGWQAAFVASGALGFVWVAAWWTIAPRTLDAAPVTRGSSAAMTWRGALRQRGVQAYVLAKFLTDPVWWFFLFWLPSFFGRVHGLDLKTLGPPLIAIYLLADVGSVVGGWASGRLMGAGLSLNAARKLAMLACALLALPVAAAPYATSLWGAAAIIGLAAAAHQGWSANLLTIASDIAPAGAVGTVSGLGAAAGAVGGMAMAEFVGRILDRGDGYDIAFAVAGSAYLVALGVLNLLLPRIRAAGVD